MIRRSPRGIRYPWFEYLIPLAFLNLHVNVGSWNNRQSMDRIQNCIHENKIKKPIKKESVLMRLKNLDSRDASLFQSVQNFLIFFHCHHHEHPLSLP